MCIAWWWSKDETRASSRRRLDDLACPFGEIDQTWAPEGRSFVLLPHRALRWLSSLTRHACKTASLFYRMCCIGIAAKFGLAAGSYSRGGTRGDILPHVVPGEHSISNFHRPYGQWTLTHAYNARACFFLRSSVVEDGMQLGCMGTLPLVAGPASDKATTGVFCVEGPMNGGARDSVPQVNVGKLACCTSSPNGWQLRSALPRAARPHCRHLIWALDADWDTLESKFPRPPFAVFLPPAPSLSFVSSYCALRRRLQSYSPRCGCAFGREDASIGVWLAVLVLGAHVAVHSPLSPSTAMRAVLIQDTGVSSLATLRNGRIRPTKLQR